MTRHPLHSFRMSLTTGLLIGALYVGGVVKAMAHDALPTAAMPQGWSYPFLCCSTTDCREVPDNAIIEGANGYTIRSTGEVIPMTDKKIKQSPDGQFHWCSVAGLDDSRTICLFVPPRSF